MKPIYGKLGIIALFSMLAIWGLAQLPYEIRERIYNIVRRIENN